MPSRVRVGSVADFADGKLHAVDAAGTPVVVGLAGDSLCAARNRCPHLGLPHQGARWCEVRRRPGRLPVAQLPLRPRIGREPRLDARLRREGHAALVAQDDRTW